MALSSKEENSRVKIGRLSAYSVMLLKKIKSFLGVKFLIEEAVEAEKEESDDDEEEEEMGEEAEEEVAKPTSHIFSCLGGGMINIARKQKD